MLIIIALNSYLLQSESFILHITFGHMGHFSKNTGNFVYIKNLLFLDNGENIFFYFLSVVFQENSGNKSNFFLPFTPAPSYGPT